MKTLVALLLASLALAAPSLSSAADREASTRLPCAVFSSDLGEYGAWVFALRHKPTHCTQYKGNRPCHCTESILTRIKWRHWGSNESTATATWHYCGMGTCIYLRARLVAFRKRGTCGEAVYTRLRMHIPRQRDRGHLFHADRQLFKLPACGGAFEYI